MLVVLGPWRFGGTLGELPAQLACLVATAGDGTALVYLRRFISPRGLAAIAVAAVQVGIGAVSLLATVSLVDGHPVSLTPAVLASAAGLGVFGTGLVYIRNTNVVSLECRGGVECHLLDPAPAYR